MSLSVDATNTLLCRVAICKARNCHVSICNQEAFRQNAVANHSLTPKAKKDVVMDDLTKQHVAQSSKNPTPYSSRASPLKLCVAGTAVCCDCYCAFYGITPKILERLKTRVRKGERKYVDKRKFVKNRFHSVESLCKAKVVADAYFNNAKVKIAFEIPDSSRTRHEQNATHVLPTTVTKFPFYDRYLDYCRADKLEMLSYPEWRKHWKLHHRDLVLGTKKTAYCDKCFQYKCREKRLTDAERQDWNYHLLHAQSLRQQYQDDIQRAHDGLVDLFCIDKAECLRAPRKASEQPSSDFFKSGFKISLNGVVDVSINKAFIHVINEAQTSEKNGGGAADANFVLSCLFDIMASKKLRPIVIIQADNCVAQNKNSYVQKFAAYLVENELCEEVYIKFMVVGHTKFSVDGCFGSLKNVMKHCDLFSELDIIKKFPDGNQENTSMHIHALPAPTWYDFKNFVESLYGKKPLSTILKYQQFHIKRDQLQGNRITLKARSHATEEFMPFAVLSYANSEESPKKLQPEGIDKRRQAELRKYFPIYAGTEFEKVFAELPICD